MLISFASIPHFREKSIKPKELFRRQACIFIRNTPSQSHSCIYALSKFSPPCVYSLSWWSTEQLFLRHRHRCFYHSYCQPSWKQTFSHQPFSGGSHLSPLRSLPSSFKRLSVHLNGSKLNNWSFYLHGPHSKTNYLQKALFWGFRLLSPIGRE